MLGEISGQLEYLRLSVHSLITSLASQQRFAQLGFIRQCAGDMQNGRPFSDSWQTALRNWSYALGKEEAEILASLGDIIGRSDLENQLSAIALTRQQLEQRIEAAREKAVTQGKLYRSMGVLVGMAAAIILI